MAFIKKILFFIFFVTICNYCQTEFRDSLISDTTLINIYNPENNLKIISYPTGAIVYINENEAGFTPFELKNNNSDSLHIKIYKHAYEPWSGVINLRDLVKKEVSVNLVPKVASISIYVEPSSSLIKLDDKTAKGGTLNDFTIQPGMHTLLIKNDSLDRVNQISFRSYPAQELYCIGKFRKVKPFRTTLNIILPGAIQLYDGDYIKGGLILGSSAAFIISNILKISDYKKSRDQYNIALQKYNNSKDEKGAYLNHNILENAKKDLDKKYSSKLTFYSLLGAVYLYSLIDALMYHIFEDSIEFTNEVDFNQSSTFNIGTGIKLKL